MRSQFRPLKWNRVLIDICTQRDFLDAGAILQVVNREQVVANTRHIFHWARTSQVPVVSIMESHRPSEPVNGFPLHCIDGTPGQEKMPFTVMSPSIVVETDNYLSLPPDLRKNYRQLLFRKRTRDILSNPKADRFLTQLVVDEYIIFGVGLDRAIRSLALGLLARHKPVTVVSDACGYWSAADSDLALRQLSAKQIQLVTTESLVAAPPPAKRARKPMRHLRDRHDPMVERRRAPAEADVANATHAQDPAARWGENFTS